MRRPALLPLLCFVLALLASGCTQPAPREEVSLDENNAVFSFALQELQEKQEFAGAVTMVVGPNRIIALEAFGLADIASGRPMRKDSVFWIASMTKPITAMGVLMLVEEGKVGLDEPVEKYLPSFKGQKVATPTGPVPAPRPVTVRDLLTHTSGLSAASLTAANQPVDTIPLAAMVDHSGRTPLISAPGAKWAYSNTGINALGRIIEVVSGQPYADFVQKRFFDPLDMNSTSFWPDDTLQASLATPYRKDKATGKENKIKIQASSGLSEDEIQKMVKDAEKFKADDEALKKRLDAKNDYENYCFLVKDSVNNEKLKDHFTNKDKVALADLCEEGLAWIDTHADSTVEEFAAQKEVVKSKYNPIMMKIYEEEKASKGI